MYFTKQTENTGGRFMNSPYKSKFKVTQQYTFRRKGWSSVSTGVPFCGISPSISATSISPLVICILSLLSVDIFSCRSTRMSFLPLRFSGVISLSSAVTVLAKSYPTRSVIQLSRFIRFFVPQ